MEVEKKSIFLELEESKNVELASDPKPELVTKYPGLALPNVNKEEIELNLDDLEIPNQLKSTQSNNTHRRLDSRSNSRERRSRRADSRERPSDRNSRSERKKSRSRET